MNRYGRTKNYLFEYKMVLSSETASYSRYVMTLMTLLGSIGGILQVMTLVISYFAEPIAEISYYINSIMSFYILHSTKYPKLVKKQKEE